MRVQFIELHFYALCIPWIVCVLFVVSFCCRHLRRFFGWLCVFYLPKTVIFYSSKSIVGRAQIVMPAPIWLFFFTVCRLRNVTVIQSRCVWMQQSIHNWNALYAVCDPSSLVFGAAAASASAAIDYQCVCELVDGVYIFWISYYIIHCVALLCSAFKIYTKCILAGNLS